MPNPATVYTLTYQDTPDRGTINFNPFMFTPPQAVGVVGLVNQAVQLAQDIAAATAIMEAVPQGAAPQAGKVVLDINHSTHDRKVVYSTSNQYCYTDYTIYVDAVLNKTRNSYFLNLARLLQVDGKTPAEIDASLRHFLLQPRKQLTIQLGQDIILQVPFGRLAPVNTDCELGPTPIDCEVSQITGSDGGTWEVRYIINVKLNETFEYIQGTLTGKVPFLLSNEWVTTENTDENLYTHRTTTGRAKFRRDWMAANTVPDDYRFSILPYPVPNWKRKVRATNNEDGTELDYVVDDVQLPYVLTRLGITSIDTKHTSSAKMPDLVAYMGFGGVTDSFNRYRAAAQSQAAAGGRGPVTATGSGVGVAAAAALAVIRPAAAVAQLAGGPASDAARQVIAGAAAIIALRSTEIVITVNGAPGTSKDTLRAVAQLVLQARLGRNLVPANAPGPFGLPQTVGQNLGMCVEATETDYGSDTQVLLTARFIGGLASQVRQIVAQLQGAAAGNAIQFVPDIGEILAASDAVPGVMQPTPTVLGGSPNDQIVMQPPGGRGIATPIVMPQLPSFPQEAPFAPFPPRGPLPPGQIRNPNLGG